MQKENDFSILELSLPNCRSNYRYFRSRLKIKTKLLVLVKANAYGHGAVEFSSMLQQAGVDYLAVALPVEGMELRDDHNLGKAPHHIPEPRYLHLREVHQQI